MIQKGAEQSAPFFQHVVAALWQLEAVPEDDIGAAIP
jgi:hypothetical protein